MQVDCEGQQHLPVCRCRSDNAVEYFRARVKTNLIKRRINRRKERERAAGRAGGPTVSVDRWPALTGPLLKSGKIDDLFVVRVKQRQAAAACWVATRCATPSPPLKACNIGANKGGELSLVGPAEATAWLLMRLAPKASSKVVTSGVDRLGQVRGRRTSVIGWSYLRQKSTSCAPSPDASANYIYRPISQIYSYMKIADLLKISFCLSCHV